MAAAGAVGGGRADIPITANLAAHYRADLGVTKDGDDYVSQWDDQSGNGRDLAEATNKPKWIDSGINSQNVIRFDGTNDNMQYTVSISQPFHFFIVALMDTWTNNDRLVDLEPGLNPSISQQGSSPQIKQQAGAAATNLVSPTLGAGFLLQSFFSGTSSFQALNNDAQSSGGNPNTMGMNTLGIGGQSNESGCSDGEFAEIALYTAEVTGGDLTTLKNYFNDEYALW